MAAALAAAAGTGLQVAAEQASARPGPGIPGGGIQEITSFADLEAKTPGEQARARFYDVFDLSGGKVATLPELWSRGVVYGIFVDLGYGEPILEVEQLTEDQALRERVCDADAVALGSIRKRKALLTSGQGLLFSEYTIEVGRWVRPVDNRSQQILSSSIGGEVRFEGKSLSIGSSVVGRFYLDEQNVYFMKSIESTDSYFFAGEPVLPAAAGGAYLDRLDRAARSC